MNVLRILGIDTSGKTASVAVLDSGTGVVLGEHSIYTSRTHSQVMLPMCKQLLEDCHLTVQEIDGFAVAAGPGSYTGLRIGIAAVQGMALVQDTPCASVSTLAALACSIGVGMVLSVLHAREDLFYYGLYDFHKPHPERMLRHMGMLAGVADIAEALQHYRNHHSDAAGPDNQVILTGDAGVFLEKLQESESVSGDRITALHLIQPVVKMPSSVGVCACAARTGFGTVADLTANYLQAVQIQHRFKSPASVGDGFPLYSGNGG